jgi:hypothetical protein
MKIGVNVHNRFDFVVADAKTGEVKQTASAYNIILNHMWNELIDGQDFFRAIYFGTGTGTLAATRTSLFTQLGYKSATLVEQVMALPTSYVKKSIVLNPEEYVGYTLTEVGVYGYSGLNTHALLEDSEGNPITIEKSATDIVTIYATIFSTIAGSTDLPIVGMPSRNELLRYLCLLSASFSGISFYVGTSDAETSQYMRGCIGYTLGSTSGSFTTKDYINKKATTALARIPVASGNGHITEIGFGNIARMVLPNATVCPAMSYEDVSVGSGDASTVKFTLPSQNVDQDSIVIKVNGTAVSNYTKALRRGINFKFASEHICGYSRETVSSRKAPSSDYWYGAGCNCIQYGHFGDGYMSQLGTNLFGGLVLHSNAFPTQFAISVDNILAMPMGSAPYISFFDVSGGTPVLSSFTFDTAPSSLVCAIDFSPDGQHMAVLCMQHKLMRYKKVGTTFTLLEEISGEPTFWNNPNNRLGSIKYFDNFLVAYEYVDGVARTIYIFVRDGDTYTMGTYTGTVFTGYGSRWPTMNTTKTKLFIPYSSGTGAIIAFTVDAAGNLTREADIALDSGKGSAYGLNMIDTDKLLVYHSTSPFITLYEFDGTFSTLTQLAVNNTTLGQSAGFYSQWFEKISDDIVITTADCSTACLDLKARTTEITFDAAPASGDAITANYSVNGIHKTDQYVLDFQVTVQYGEG